MTKRMLIILLFVVKYYNIRFKINWKRLILVITKTQFELQYARFQWTFLYYFPGVIGFESVIFVVVFGCLDLKKTFAKISHISWFFCIFLENFHWRLLHGRTDTSPTASLGRGNRCVSISLRARYSTLNSKRLFFSRLDGKKKIHNNNNKQRPTLTIATRASNPVNRMVFCSRWFTTNSISRGEVTDLMKCDYGIQTGNPAGHNNNTNIYLSF